MTGNVQPIRNVLAAVAEAPIDAVPAPANDRDGKYGGRPPKVMPDGCPVIPVGTENGTFYFLTALGELRGLTCDKVANKHIVGMFAPDSDYLMEAWPRKKLVKTKDDDGNEVEEWLVTGWRNDDVAMLLMDVAAAKGVWNAREKVRGRGAWVDDDGGLVLHCGNHVLLGGTWKRPGMHDAMVYPTMPPIPTPKGDKSDTAAMVAPKLVDELRSKGIELAADASPAMALFELLKTWNWDRPLIDPVLMLGWLAVAPFGGALDYRPIIWTTGGKAAGKTSLQFVMDWLFDGGILQSPNASEAGIRQTLGQQSLPVGLDEAEAEADNRKLLALVTLARLAATSQGNIIRGGQDHQASEFRATSCFLFSSILVPPLTPADKSRIGLLELKRLPPGSKKPKLDKREFNAIGAWMRKRFADRWHEWEGILSAFTDALLEEGKQSSRAADQFGTLRAGAHILLDPDPPEAEELTIWGGLLSIDNLAETAGEVDEGPMCLDHLMSSPVQLGARRESRLVEDWLADAVAQPRIGAAPEVAAEFDGRRRKADEALGQIGLKVVRVTDKPPVPGRAYLAIADAHQALGKLLENSKFRDGVWSQPLGRIDGAVKAANRRIGKRQTKCTLVPLDAVIPTDDDAVAGAAAERVDA